MSNEGKNTIGAPAQSNEHTTERPAENTPRKPDYAAYNVRDTQDGKGNWTKIGAAWIHGDGKGLQLQLDNMPIDGRVTLREMRHDRLKSYADQRQERNDSNQDQSLTTSQKPNQNHGYQR